MIPEGDQERRTTADTASLSAADFFDAALTPAHWPRILRRLAEDTGQTALALSGQGRTDLTGPFFSWGIDDARIATFMQKYAHAKDNLAMDVFDKAPLGQASSWRSLLSEKDWDSIPLFRDLIHPMGLEHKFAMNLFWDGSYGGLLSVLGPPENPVSEDALAQTTALHRYLAPAFEITCRMALADRESRSLWQAFSTLGLGLVIQSGAGAVSAMNPIAERLMQNASGSTPDLPSPKAHAPQTPLVRDAFVIAHRLPRPLLALRLPLQQSDIGQWSDARSFLVILLEFDRDSPHLWQIVQSVFGATPRQSEVGQLVLEGRTTPQIAAELGISPSTVETHVDRLCVQMGLENRTMLRSWLEQIRAIV